MNTQKIQTGTVGTKGFTLVELIVVITILVILGTIAFLNLGGMSASARDSQRTSDLNQINQQILVQQAKSGLSYSAMVDGTGSNLTTIKLGGLATITSGYAAGKVNYTVLGIDQTKFQDPTKGVAYKMGSTIYGGSAYELAASLEESKTALVMGTYRQRLATTLSTVTASGTVLTISTNLGNLKLNDVISNGGTATGTVNGISADLTRITLSTAMTATGIALANTESAGLIASYASGAIAATNGGTNLPYTLD